MRSFTICENLKPNKAGTNLFNCIYATHDFMLYTATNLICTLGGNIALNGYVKKHYPYIRKYKNESITVQEKKLIKSKVFALIYHKIGGYLVNGGDNFILSGFLGVATVGYYSNYTFITNTLKSLIASVFAGFMSGFGNLNATEDSSRSEVVFKRARICLMRTDWKRKTMRNVAMLSILR